MQEHTNDRLIHSGVMNGIKTDQDLLRRFPSMEHIAYRYYRNSHH